MAEQQKRIKHRIISDCGAELEMTVTTFRHLVFQAVLPSIRVRTPPYPLNASRVRLASPLSLPPDPRSLNTLDAR